MSPSPDPQTPSQPHHFATENRRMPMTLNRFLDVAVSVLIVFLTAVTAGATASLGA